ncbi:phospholipid phosphatase 1-like [Uloborus diversus]|uniref:phospholipid phosphatase 1-like n=1 Tax=Uloborus diversus TaxID=327109 RepID=UPI0024095E12|nr:phospholipid phosphatase 1-like [Uloborus diversus]
MKSHFRFHLKYYLSGFILVAGFTEALKFSCCELRPHFFYTCLPDMSKINCSDGYITNFNCTGEGPEWLVERDIYKSFPSGHASFSFYSFVFMSVYIVSRMRHASKSLVNSACSRGIPILCLVWTLACCITRILDNRHFWWDVLSGVVIGLVGGLVTVFACLKASAEKKPASKNS